MKRMVCLLLTAMLCLFAGAIAEEAALREAMIAKMSFPFLAQPLEEEAEVFESIGGEITGRIKTDEQIKVLSVTAGAEGEYFYEIELADGKLGYVRAVQLAALENLPILRAEQDAEQTQEEAYIGNKNTKKFHKPSCHTLPAEKNRVSFSSRDEAVELGYQACKNCKP